MKSKLNFIKQVNTNINKVIMNLYFILKVNILKKIYASELIVHEMKLTAMKSDLLLKKMFATMKNNQAGPL